MQSKLSYAECRKRALGLSSVGCVCDFIGYTKRPFATFLASVLVGSIRSGASAQGVSPFWMAVANWPFLALYFFTKIKVYNEGPAL
jgi:hypothetical protein